MTSDIRKDLNSRGILVPGDDASRMLPEGWDAKPNKRPKRALMRTSSSDLRWPTGSSGKREIPYQIESSNSKLYISEYLRIYVCFCSMIRSD